MLSNSAAYVKQTRVLRQVSDRDDFFACIVNSHVPKICIILKADEIRFLGSVSMQSKNRI